MTKIIEGDLELKEDTTFDESIEVHGNITCPNGRKNLTVAGNIDAWNIVAGNIDALDIVAGNIVAGNIDAGNIDAGNIDAGDIVAGNIDALDIVAGNIDAGDIVCVSRKKKSKTAKTIAYSIVLDRFNRERKEVMPEAHS